MRNIAVGSLCVAVALTALLAIYDIQQGHALRSRFWIACIVVMYITFIYYVLRNGHASLANWLLIILYEILAGVVFLFWGLSSSAGLLAACFVILLPGILMTPRYILPVAVLTISILIATYIIHSLQLIKPIIYVPEVASSLLDVVAYSTIFSIFALISWMTASQYRKLLTRATLAEQRLLKQRHTLASELSEESSKLRQTQLQQIQQLYRFAVIGQSTAATLHELSNHLSVLNLDIHDLKTQHKHSQAIANAEEGMEYINRMVRRARRQLNSPVDHVSSFNVAQVVEEVLNDLSHKFEQKGIVIAKDFPSARTKLQTRGEPLNLAQCVTVLLNNSFEACGLETNPEIKISISKVAKSILVTVTDNGPGISGSAQDKLFQPLESTKPTGLGVGLYIAKHLIESHFKGTLTYIPTASGATFQITIKATTSP